MPPFSWQSSAPPPRRASQLRSSSKSLLANVLDIDDDFRCNHRCSGATLPHQPTYYRTVYR